MIEANLHIDLGEVGKWPEYIECVLAFQDAIG